MTRFIILLGALLLVSIPAHAQDWYEAFNEGGSVINTIHPPGGQAPYAAHYTITQAETTDSNALNVSNCHEVIITVYQSDLIDDGDTGDGTPGSFDIRKSPDASKTVSTRVLWDVNGDGVVKASTGDDRPMTGDDGTNWDADGTEEQAGTVYGITGVNFIWVDPQAAPGDADDHAYVEVSCR